MSRSGRDPCPGSRGRGGRLCCARIGIVENACAGFAVKEFLIFRTLQLLDHVRPDMHAALATTLTANFCQGDTPVPLCDALIVVDQILRDSRNCSGTHSFTRSEFLLPRIIFGLNLVALQVRGGFYLFYG